MKRKVITTAQGRVVIDEDTKIEVNTYYENNGVIFLSDSVYDEGNNPNNSNPRVTDFNNKILYTINFSLDKDIPMIIVEDEVDNLALEWCLINKFNPEDYVHSNRTAEYSIVKTIWANGYKSLQQKGVYSEEDLRNAIDFGDNFQHTLLTPTGKKAETDKFIQSLKQEYIELEMDKLYIENRPVTRIKTDRIDGQLIAYIKNFNHETQSNNNRTRQSSCR